LIPTLLRGNKNKSIINDESTLLSHPKNLANQGLLWNGCIVPGSQTGVIDRTSSTKYKHNDLMDLPLKLVICIHQVWSC
ncbi:MAG: hypothetical protein MUO76_11540, partial [Anaerolineaceae bacterium]|nr:hypothetical protein [Anaerolineaceae bacterium]